jgi:uncharacterized OsmC-like protein
MTDILIDSTSEDGFTTTSIVGDFELTIDATGEDGPGPNATLVATYASCYIPAFRVAAEQRDYDDVGRIEVESEADLDDDDDLTAIRFDISVEEDLGDDAEEIVDRGEDICHVHSAVREELHAEITVEDDAF